MALKSIEEKLKHFTTVTIENVNDECEKSLAEHKEMLDKRYEEHKKEQLRISKLKAKTLQDEIERKASKEYTEEQLLIKRALTKKQEELKEMLFNKVREKLMKYRETPAYIELLAREIEEAKGIARGENVEIYIDKADENMIEKLEERCHVKLHMAEKTYMGGIRAEIPKKNILIDHRFETEIEELREEFKITL